jgi:divalent metal cation (Fe/Co/Zn/Cd) transporter
MPKSFIIIDVDENLKETVKDAIKKHPCVSAVYTVVDDADGERIIYDIIVKVEADSTTDLDDAESQIRTRKEVRSSLTLEVIKKENTEGSTRVI